jgi:hypothetical protein
MTNKHTPGPWRIGDAGFTVFGPPKPGAFPETIATIKSRANASLIATAPEMADILADIVLWNNEEHPRNLEAAIRRGLRLLQTLGIEPLVNEEEG